MALYEGPVLKFRTEHWHHKPSSSISVFEQASKKQVPLSAPH